MAYSTGQAGVGRSWLEYSLCCHDSLARQSGKNSDQLAGIVADNR